MKKTIAWMLFLGYLGLAQAQTFYVDTSNGNDTWLGTVASPQGTNGPWRTIGRVNTASLVGGDSVLFKCGEIWREQLTITSPVSVASYGTSCATSKPIIDASKPITAWGVYSGAIYVADAKLIKEPSNYITNSNFEVGDSTVTTWTVWPVDGLAARAWIPNCNGTAGCLGFNGSSAKGIGVISSSTFPVGFNKTYTIEFSLAGSKTGQGIWVSVKRNGSPFDYVGLSNTNLVVGTGWQRYKIPFTATSTLDNARLDFQVLADETIYIDNVVVKQTTPEYEQIKQVFADGSFLSLAHHPNAGYSSLSPSSVYLSIAQDSQIATGVKGSSYLTAGSDLVLTPTQQQEIIGAGIHTRTNPYIIDDRIVSTYDPLTKVISLDKPSTYQLRLGWGYYFDNKLWMLDKPGEWYYDPSTQKLYVWMPDSQAPGARVEAGHYGYGIYAVATSGVVIDGLDVRKAGTGIDLSRSINFALRNTRVSDSQNRGVQVADSSYGVIDKCEIENSVREGIWGWGSSNLTLSNNLITNSGVIGTPKKAWGAIEMGSTNTNYLIIKDNIVKNSGYIGIDFGKNSTVSNNYVKDSCVVLDDCGGIYTNGFYAGGAPNNNYIVNNIVENVLGNPNGRPAGVSSAAQGIYLDDSANAVYVTNNTVINADYTVQIHNGFSNTLIGNTLYNGRRGLIWMQEDTLASAGAIHDNIVTANRFFPLIPTESILLSSTFDTISFALFDTNRYSSLYSHNLAKETYKPGGISVNNYYDLLRWQQIRGADLYSSSFGLFGAAPSRTLGVNSSNLISNSTFEAGIASWAYFPLDSNPIAQGNCAIGGCLKFTGGSANSYLYSNTFSIRKDKSYLVRFDLRAEQDAQGVTVLLSEGGPLSYNAIGLNKSLTAATSWESYSFVFKASLDDIIGTPPNQNGARLNFVVLPGQTIYVDNVKVVEVSAEYNDPSDDSAILFNAESVPKAIDCPDLISAPTKCSQYVSFSDESPVTFPVTVPAMGSKIIVWAANPFKDTDRDYVLDSNDLCPNTFPGSTVDENGCSFSQQYPGDLALVQTASPDTLTAGDNLSYRFTVTNSGASTAHGVTLKNSLPAGVSFISISTSQGSCTGSQAITCSLGNMASAGSAVVSLVVKALTAGTFANTASVNGAEADPNPGNNTATTTVTVTVPPYPAIDGFWKDPSSPKVYLFGKNFLIDGVRPIVKFSEGTLLANVRQVSATQVIVLEPLYTKVGRITLKTPIALTISPTAYKAIQSGLTVNGFSPTETKVGAMGYIFGSGFSTTQANQVSINGVPAAFVQAADNTMLFYMVPTGASSGLVKVTTGGVTATSSTNLVIVP